MKTGDRLTSKGKQLTLKQWLPNAGINIKGKWLCIDKRGITCHLSETELTQRGYLNKEARTMTTKGQIERDEKHNVLWCTRCLKDLTTETTWIPDDTHDGRRFCLACAPDDAIRAKDIS